MPDLEASRTGGISAAGPASSSNPTSPAIRQLTSDDLAELQDIESAPVKTSLSGPLMDSEDEADTTVTPGDVSVPPESSVSADSTASAPAKKEIRRDHMQLYYERLFPYRYLFQWLNHSPAISTDFTNREFAFELKGGVYMRYNSFKSIEEFRKELLRLVPTRFEVGAVYTANPRDRKILAKSALKPLEKELVFDIDLTDYDGIRTCCSKTDICYKCWKFITVAMEVINSALREDFGFESLLWVYSGRRGAHCWVSDASARSLSDQERRAVVEYLDIFKNSKNGRLVLKRPLHPHLTRSLDILKQHFAEIILQEQDPWRNDPEPLLSAIPDKLLALSLRKEWDDHPGRSSESKWEDIDRLAARGVSKKLDTRALAEAKKDIVLQYLYPKLDVNVSVLMGHLLKSPFCIHPGTGNVCVPISGSDFDPFAVPRIDDLLQELADYEAKEVQISESKDSGEEESPKERYDYNKTGLKTYIEQFSRHVQQVVSANRKLKREHNELEF